MLLNAGRLTLGNVPKHHVDLVCMRVPKLPTLCADFFDFETETGKNTDERPSQNNPYNPER
jgi:hypothetical protein